MAVLLILLAGLASIARAGQAADPAFDSLENAYAALRERRYEAAISFFLKAIESAPDRPSARKDLAYTYLKTGENEAAREQFAEVMRLDPHDHRTALEYAFLCHELKETAAARRVFDRIRMTGDPESSATAEIAFQNIDRPLAEGIARWSRALELSPDDFSAHHELARLAEQRDELALAAEHYEKAWRLRRDLWPLLVNLGRVRKAMGSSEHANAALLAASRGSDPRAAEAARDLLPSRYPYVYEFRQALELNPENTELRRELAYLLAAMGRQDEADKEFAALKAAGPHGLRQRSELSIEAAAGDPKTMAVRSYKAGYLNDALNYFRIAHESDPLDFQVMLQLGWTYNMLGQDHSAIHWFQMARRSPNPAIAAEASRAYRNLRPSLARFRTTAWLFPSYSSRWSDMLSYGQVKTEMKLGRLPLRAYLSTRFIGDTRRAVDQARPEYLSESSFIAGAGLATGYWRGAMLWAEAGSALNYSRHRRNAPRMAPDYRGGLAFSKGFGRLLGGEQGGGFFETNKDAVFISRFQNDLIVYSQNRAGCTFPVIERLGGFRIQLYWNGNASADLRRQYWANVAEFGPGIRFRWKSMPSPWLFSVNLIRGVYTRNAGNPRGPNFFDVRVGFWYAFAR